MLKVLESNAHPGDIHFEMRVGYVCFMPALDCSQHKFFELGF